MRNYTSELQIRNLKNSLSLCTFLNLTFMSVVLYCTVNRDVDVRLGATNLKIYNPTKVTDVC